MDSTTLGLGMVTLLLGDDTMLVGKLVVDGLDRRVHPVGSALPAFSAGDEGVSLLGGGPEVGMDSVLGMASLSAAV